MRLIDADKLTPRCMFKGRCDSGGGLGCDRCTDYSVEYQDIKNAPIMSPERKTGKWINYYRNGFGNLIARCDQCGHSYPVDNFCPNCGADMRGKQEWNSKS